MKLSLRHAWLVVAGLTACSSNGSSAPSAVPSASSTTSAAEAAEAAKRSFAGCHAEQIENDLRMTPTQMTDLKTVPEGQYFISTTYLALVPDPSGQAAFRRSMTDLLNVLPQAPGLLAFRFGTSESCLSARTLAVWRDEASMRAFVNSPAHHAAMRIISTISRGDSTFAHWPGRLESAEWANVGIELSRQDGPRL